MKALILLTIALVIAAGWFALKPSDSGEGAMGDAMVAVVCGVVAFVMLIVCVVLA